jgi:hypothetical protein
LLHGHADRYGLGHFQQLAALHIVDEAVDWDFGRHQRVIAEPADIGHDAVMLSVDGKPVDVLALGLWRIHQVDNAEE